jgi:hypothetical protein
LIIGLIASVILGVTQQVVDSGIVTSAGALQLLGLVITIVPLVAAAIIRQFVTPVGKVTDPAGPAA